jgi:hypothetical protein
MTHMMVLKPLLGLAGSIAPAALAKACMTGTVPRLRAIRKDVRAWQRDTAAVTENLRRDREMFRTTLDVPFWDNLDELIELAEGLEQGLAKDHSVICSLADQLIARGAALPPNARELAQEIARTAVNVHADYVEALRDARWELIIRRTEREPPPPPGPPEELDSYLHRLLGV